MSTDSIGRWMTMQIAIKPIPKRLFHTLGKQPLSIYQAFRIELMLSFTLLLLCRWTWFNLNSSYSTRKITKVFFVHPSQHTECRNINWLLSLCNWIKENTTVVQCAIQKTKVDAILKEKINPGCLVKASPPLPRCLHTGVPGFLRMYSEWTWTDLTHSISQTFLLNDSQMCELWQKKAEKKCRVLWIWVNLKEVILSKRAMPKSLLHCKHTHNYWLLITSLANLAAFDKHKWNHLQLCSRRNEHFINTLV